MSLIERGGRSLYGSHSDRAAELTLRSTAQTDWAGSKNQLQRLFRARKLSFPRIDSKKGSSFDRGKGDEEMA